MMLYNSSASRTRNAWWESSSTVGWYWKTSYRTIDILSAFKFISIFSSCCLFQISFLTPKFVFIENYTTTNLVITVRAVPCFGRSSSEFWQSKSRSCSDGVKIQSKCCSCSTRNVVWKPLQLHLLLIKKQVIVVLTYKK